MRIFSGLIILLAAPLVIVGCIGGAASTTTKPSEERFREGMAYLDENEYLKAREQFEIIILQDPASEYVDDAQFYLAESYFRNSEYKLAAYNYNRLRQSFPRSPFYKQSLFKASECYYSTSEPFDRDQRETVLAIDQYKIFIDLYPADSLTPMARDRVRELRNKLALKEFAVAEQYMKMGEYEAVTIYCNRVIEKYPDTDYNRLASDMKDAAMRELEGKKKHVTDEYLNERIGKTTSEKAKAAAETDE